MNSYVKFLIDFGPLAIFFIFYKKTGDILEAILPLIIATLISIIISYIVEKKIPVMPSIGATIILIFGGLSLYFDNKIFIFMKPTILNVLFSSALIIGNILKKPLLKTLMGGNKINLSDQGWFELSKRWSIFFIFLALLNEIIWRNFSEEMWVNFKVFGILILTFIFSITLFPLLTKYQKKK